MPQNPYEYSLIDSFSVDDKERLAVDSIREIMLKIHIPPDYNNKTINIVYQLENKTGKCVIGQPLVATIEVSGEQYVEKPIDGLGGLQSNVINQQPPLTQQQNGNNIIENN